MKKSQPRRGVSAANVCLQLSHLRPVQLIGGEPRGLGRRRSTWRPGEFHQELFGCETGIRFPTKLLDLAANEAELEASENPFSKVVLAHLKAQQTSNDPGGRCTWKIRLVRGLYERGFNAKDARELLRVIDWLMEVPTPLDDIFWEEVETLQKEGHMPFISTPERIGVKRGLRKGIEAVLRVRFGPEGLALMPEIMEVHDEDRLTSILTALETVERPDEVRRFWAPEPAK